MSLLRWSFLAPCVAAMELQWSIVGTVGAAMELRWSIVETVSAAMELQWSIAGTVGAAMQLQWSIDGAAMQRGWCCPVTRGSCRRQSCNAMWCPDLLHLIGGRSFNATVCFIAAGEMTCCSWLLAGRHLLQGDDDSWHVRQAATRDGRGDEAMDWFELQRGLVKRC